MHKLNIISTYMSTMSWLFTINSNPNTGSFEKEAFQMSILSSGFWKKRRNEKAPNSLVFYETQCL